MYNRYFYELFLFDKVKIILRQYFVSFPGELSKFLRPREVVFLPLREAAKWTGTEPCRTARLASSAAGLPVRLALNFPL